MMKVEATIHTSLKVLDGESWQHGLAHQAMLVTRHRQKTITRHDTQNLAHECRL